MGLNGEHARGERRRRRLESRLNGCMPLVPTPPSEVWARVQMLDGDSLPDVDQEEDFGPTLSNRVGIRAPTRVRRAAGQLMTLIR